MVKGFFFVFMELAIYVFGTMCNEERKAIAECFNDTFSFRLLLGYLMHSNYLEMKNSTCLNMLWEFDREYFELKIISKSFW